MSLGPPPQGGAALFGWLRQLWDEFRSLVARVVDLEAGGGGGTRIFAEYTHSAAQSLSAAAWTIMQYNTLVESTGITITTGASWKATCDTAGDYLVTVSSLIDTTGSPGGNRFSGMLWKNGALTGARRLYDGATESGTSSPVAVGGAVVMKLAAGDYIDFRIYTGSAGQQTATNAYDNWFVIKKLAD